MSGQIPKYGGHFKHDRAERYHISLGQALYRFKWDEDWFIRSDKTAKRWYIFSGRSVDTAIHMGKVQPSLTKAMTLLLDGVKQGFYVARLAHTNKCGLQGSGLNKHCTCGLDEFAKEL